MSAALSLRCVQCGTQLRSVAEAQTHGEMTGHEKFEESTEAVLNQMCTECGKPCRNQTDMELHTKRTGHATFQDKTSEAKAMDTEGEMRQAAAEQREEAGLPPPKPKADGGRDTVDLTGDQEKEPVEMVAPEVDEGLQKQLEEMGFGTNRAIRALHFTGTANLEQAVNWIVEHAEEADIDEPLLVPKTEPKKQLTPEEARQQAEELVRKAKEKKRKEEAELERLREQERIRAGKELLNAKRLEDEQQLKRNVEERKREKEEEARARERIRAKLAEDKRERRRKLGLPEEPSQEELAKEAEAAAEKKRRAEAGKLQLPAKPIGVAQQLRARLTEMKKAAGPDDPRPKTAWATMLKYIGNVATNPGEEKYRRIKLTNAAFQSRVACLPGAVAFLEIVGFQKGVSGEVLELPAEKVDAAVLQVAGEEINNALTNPFFGTL